MNEKNANIYEESMNEITIIRWVNKINKMDYEEMLDLWNNAPLEHPLFNSNTILPVLFAKRFSNLKKKIRREK